jgi:hypothetical protein
VPESCKPIAIIELTADDLPTGDGYLIQAARRRAGKIGANAIQAGDIRGPSTGRRVANAVLGPAVSLERRGSVLAFRCTGEPTSLWRRIGEALGLVD